MKSIIKFSVFIFFTGIILFISCKKDLSCENCIGGNQPPIANAGRDTTTVLPVDSVMLDGSASYDPDGKIVSSHWSKISGLASFIIANANSVQTQVTNLVL